MPIKDPILKAKYQKEYYLKNKQKLKEQFKKYHLIHKDQILDRHKDYRHDKHDQIRETNKRYQTKMEKEDINFLLKRRLRTRLYVAIKGSQKVGSAIKDLGCSIPELKEHIEKQFQPGMSWDNWGPKTWHIDHRKALANFDLTNRSQFLEANHYTNLQPLWAEENIQKGSK